ncbi:MAG TPA: hypothetical protein VNF73_09275 [Candidatus Saccharimonadales bacterium]|nr:hypothetical protein [Candidatus Saccharimonadales bacterium]
MPRQRGRTTRLTSGRFSIHVVRWSSLDEALTDSDPWVRPSAQADCVFDYLFGQTQKARDPDVLVQLGPVNPPRGAAAPGGRYVSMR